MRHESKRDSRTLCKGAKLNPGDYIWRGKIFARLRGTASGHVKDLLLSILLLHASRMMRLTEVCVSPCRLIRRGFPFAEAGCCCRVPDDRLERIAIVNDAVMKS